MTNDERLYEQVVRSWGYDDPTHEGSGEQLRCPDCLRPIESDPRESLRMLRLPESWAECLRHPGLLHHAICFHGNGEWLERHRADEAQWTDLAKRIG